MGKVSTLAALLGSGLLILGSGCASSAATPVPISTAQVPTQAAGNAPATPQTIAAVAPAQAPGVTPAPVSAVGGDALFSLSNLKITPGLVKEGGQVKVTVTVKNIGGQSGTYNAVLDMKGDDEACPMISPEARDITLAAGASQDVVFNVIMGAGSGGGYTVTIGSLKGALIVQ